MNIVHWKSRCWVLNLEKSPSHFSSGTDSGIIDTKSHLSLQENSQPFSLNTSIVFHMLENKWTNIFR